MRSPESSNAFYDEDRMINIVNSNHEAKKRAEEARERARLDEIKAARAEKERLSRAEKEAELKRIGKIRKTIKNILLTAAIGGMLVGGAAIIEQIDVNAFENAQAGNIEHSNILTEYHIGEDDVDFNRGEMKFTLGDTKYELKTNAIFTDEKNYNLDSGIIEGTAIRRTSEGEDVRHFEIEKDENGDREELSIDGAIARLGLEESIPDSKLE